MCFEKSKISIWVTLTWANDRNRHALFFTGSRSVSGERALKHCGLGRCDAKLKRHRQATTHKVKTLADQITPAVSVAVIMLGEQSELTCGGWGPVWWNFSRHDSCCWPGEARRRLAAPCWEVSAVSNSHIIDHCTFPTFINQQSRNERKLMIYKEYATCVLEVSMVGMGLAFDPESGV